MDEQPKITPERILELCDKEAERLNTIIVHPCSRCPHPSIWGGWVVRREGEQTERNPYSITCTRHGLFVCGRNENDVLKVWNQLNPAQPTGHYEPVSFDSLISGVIIDGG